MASAYAALVSLMNVLHIIKHPKNPESHLDKSQIHSLFDKVNSLVDLLETHSKRISKDLESKMTDAAFAAEDTIESYLVDIRRVAKVSSSDAAAVAEKEDTIESYLVDRRKPKSISSSRRIIHIKKKSTSVEGQTSRPLLLLNLDKAIDKAIQEILSLDLDPVLSRGLVSADVDSKQVPPRNLLETHSLDLDKAIQEMKLPIPGAVQAKENNGKEDQLQSKDLEKKMTDAATEAEDVTETDLVERRKPRSTPFTFQAQKSTSVEETSRPLAAMGIQSHPKMKRKFTSVEETSCLLAATVFRPHPERKIIKIKKESTSAVETSRPPFSLDLDKAIQEMDLIIQEVMQAKQNNGEQEKPQSNGVAPAVDSTSVPRPVKVVGLKEETNHLMDQLTSYQSNRHVIPIVGMGGLGKTTLATNVYNHPHLKCHFDVKAWVTISQVYTPRTIFVPLLRDIGVKNIDKIKDEELGEKLHKALFGRRYLVIIDDIWDLKAWDEMIRFCPDNNNGSRILLTTRLLDVANRVSSCSPFDMQLLDVYGSWDLLSKTVFEQEFCPPELRICGMEIAKNCKGLPLAIVVIGGLLKESDRTRERWEHVERNTRSIIGGEDNDHCMKILSLSYHQLPIHLKPCFLYMATFPGDSEIQVSEVTKLWAADGFLKPTTDGKTLDEVALECLKDLARRNLVIVNKRNHRWEKKCLTVHDLVRDLCIKQAQKEKFVYLDDGVVSLPNSLEGQRRLVVHENGCILYRGMQQNGLYRSFIWFNRHQTPPEISGFSFFRVLMFSSYWSGLVEANIQPFNLRFLKLSIEKEQVYLLSSISWALNLETLILCGDDDYSLPVQIWNLWRLKHLVINGSYDNIIMPDPPTGSDFVLENLQTLEGVRVLSDIVLDRIPNIKIMRIEYDHGDKMEPPPCFDNFVHCHKLEKLWFGVTIPGTLEAHKFPSYPRKLTLWKTTIPWEKMTIVGSLPNLEFLSLEYGAFIGEEWKSVEGEFEKLKYLRICSCYLERWIVEESSHFPSLEELELKDMYKLEEIPLVFRELMTLVSINMESCSDSALISARQILEEQQQGGNDDLIVDGFHFDCPVELKEELKGLPNDNFHLKIL